MKKLCHEKNQSLLVLTSELDTIFVNYSSQTPLIHYPRYYRGRNFKYFLSVFLIIKTIKVNFEKMLKKKSI